MATDADGEELTFSVLNLPAWASLDAQTGSELGLITPVTDIDAAIVSMDTARAMTSARTLEFGIWYKHVHSIFAAGALGGPLVAIGNSGEGWELTDLRQSIDLKSPSGQSCSKHKDPNIETAQLPGVSADLIGFYKHPGSKQYRR